MIDPIILPLSSGFVDIDEKIAFYTDHQIFERYHKFKFRKIFKNKLSIALKQIMGDGELQEGQNWEAIMYASANKVDNIVVTVDLNGQQIDGSTENVLSLGNLKSKFNAFGWEVIECFEGNNIDKIKSSLKEAKEVCFNNKPVCILLKTIMGNGVDFMMHTHEWHGKAPNDDQLMIGLNQNKETLGDY